MTKVALQFDVESEMHRTMAAALHEEIVKPLKILGDNQNKCRKPVELRVEKVVRSLVERRAGEGRGGYVASFDTGYDRASQNAAGAAR